MTCFLRLYRYWFVVAAGIIIGGPDNIYIYIYINIVEISDKKKQSWDLGSFFLCICACQAFILKKKTSVG